MLFGGGQAAMYKKILMAFNGSREGRSALLESAEIAEFIKAETHLLAVAGMPPSLFLTEGFLPEELLEEEKKRTQEILDEGIKLLQDQGFNTTGHFTGGDPVGVTSRDRVDLEVALVERGPGMRLSFAARWWK